MTSEAVEFCQFKNKEQNPLRTPALIQEAPGLQVTRDWEHNTSSSRLSDILLSLWHSLSPTTSEDTADGLEQTF